MKNDGIENAVLKVLEYPKVLEMLGARAATSLGKNAALGLKPAVAQAVVQHLLDETSQAFSIINEDKPPPFGGATDVTADVKKAHIEAVLEPARIRAVGNFLYAARRVRDFLLPYAEKTPLLSEKAANITVLSHLEQAIENAISDNLGVSDNASPELARLRREIRVSQSRVKEKLENILKSSEYQKYFQEQLVTIRGDRYVIPVKQEYRQYFPGIVHDQSGSGATVFIEPLSVVELNNDVKKMLSEEKEEVERILRLLSAQIGKVAGAVLENLAIVTDIDLIFAKAKWAQDFNAVKPVLSLDGRLDIKEARHPLIDQALVVPVDIRAGGEVRTLLITGSNAGGKTVTLKIIGLFALMAQSGLFLPAQADSTAPVFKAVYADIGDEQSIEQSLSTFSGQVKNLVEILARAGEGSLVLLDEICAGTDPKEGAALAMAILERLQKDGATTVLTTHYSELKTFAFQTSGMENASVEFDAATLRPTYRLLMGLPGSSNAFHISHRLGLAADIVEKAKSYMDSEYKKMEEILRELEEERKKLAAENAGLENLRREAALLKDRIIRQERDISAKKQEIIEKCRAEAAEVTRRARLDAESAIKEIKALHQEESGKIRQQVIDAARKKLAPADFGEVEEVSGEVLTEKTAKPGVWVYVPSLRQKGRILSISGKEAALQMGLLKTNLPFAKCVLTESPSEKEAPKTGRKRAAREVAKTMEFKSEIDVRGKTVEEAILDIDKYIDDALIAGIGQVRIIHGKGTGALRSGLIQYLNKHAAVKSHTLAALNEGGSGATVVFL